MINLDTLEATAKAATPGEWTNRRVNGRRRLTHEGSKAFAHPGPPECVYTPEFIADPNCVEAGGRELIAFDSHEDYALSVADASHIAAFSPATALALIAELREAREKVGTPPEGSHPDEAKPRDETWHKERANWQSEVARREEYGKGAEKGRDNAIEDFFTAQAEHALTLEVLRGIVARCPMCFKEHAGRPGCPPAPFSNPLLQFNQREIAKVQAVCAGTLARALGRGP